MGALELGMPGETVAETERLRLRKLTTKDRRTLAIALNTPEVTQLLGGVLSEEKQEKFFEWLLAEQQKEYGHTFWYLEVKEGGDFIGICGLVTVDEEDSTVLGATEIGYRLTPSAQGKGFGTEAAIASLRYAFEVEEAWRVVSRTTLENVQSWSLMKRIGMHHDPRLDYVSKDGTPFVVHSITTSEWSKR